MKKQLSTAMAAAMAFGTVVPAFTSEVSAADKLSILDNVKRIIDMRVASGLVLVGADGKPVASANKVVDSITDLLPGGSIVTTTNPTASGKTANGVSARNLPYFAEESGVPVLTRAQVYNYSSNNADNRDKHTLKSQFVGCEVLYQKLDPKDPSKDIFVLAKPATTDADKLAAQQAKIEQAKMEKAIEGLKLLGYTAKTYTDRELSLMRPNENPLLGSVYYDGVDSNGVARFVSIDGNDTASKLLSSYDATVQNNKYYQGRKVVVMFNQDGTPLKETIYVDANGKKVPQGTPGANPQKVLVTFTFANKNQELSDVSKLRNELFAGLANLENNVNVTIDGSTNTATLDFYEMTNKNASGDDYLQTQRPVTAEEERQLYHATNLFKYRLEQMKDKVTVKVDEYGTKNQNTKAVVYAKGTTDVIMTLDFKNTIEVKKNLIVNMPNVEKTDFAKHWAKDYIVDSMLAGYVDASSEFRPKDNITRAEFAKIVCTVFGIDTRDEAIKNLVNPFSDIKEGEWHYRYIAALYNEGTNGSIINGYQDGTFKPKGEITRQEAAKMVAAAYDLKVEALNTTGQNSVAAKKDGVVEKIVAVNGQTIHVDTITAFKDDKEIANWADESITALTKENIINGYQDNTFKPNNKINRAEALTMLVRTNKITADDSDIK